MKLQVINSNCAYWQDEKTCLLAYNIEFSKMNIYFLMQTNLQSYGEHYVSWSFTSNFCEWISRKLLMNAYHSGGIGTAVNELYSIAVQVNIGHQAMFVGAWPDWHSNRYPPHQSCKPRHIIRGHLHVWYRIRVLGRKPCNHRANLPTVGK